MPAQRFEAGKARVIADIFGASLLSKVSRTCFDVIIADERTWLDDPTHFAGDIGDIFEPFAA